MRSIILYISQIILFIIIVLSYHPFFIGEIGNANENNVLNYPILALCALLFIFSFKAKVIRNYPIRFIGGMFFLIIIEFFLLDALNFNKIFENDHFILLIPLIAIITGYNSNYGEKQMYRMLLVFVLTSLFVGFSQILQSIGGFSIANVYVLGKNSLGCILSTAFTISMYLFYAGGNKRFNVFWIALAFLFLIEMLTLRTRTAFLGSLFIASVMFILFYIRQSGYIKLKILFWSALIVLAICMIFLVNETFLTDSIDNYIYNSFMQNHEQDFTSGRTNLLSEAIDTLSLSPIWVVFHSVCLE